MLIPKPIVEAAACDLARKRFYYFCRVLYPRFYTPDKVHLETLADTLQAFYEDRLLGADGQPVKNLIINLPPRFGKSYTTSNFCKWMFGHDPKASVITVSYNQLLSMRAGKGVRNAIMEGKVPGGPIVYSDIFPETRITEGDGAMDIWSLEGSHFSYLSTSPTGTLTGIGTKLLIVDDLIKDAYEANHEGILENHWSWWRDTALSRLESGGKKLIIMTRWSRRDLAGRVLEADPDKWHVIQMPACIDEDKGIMLCPQILDYKEYCDRKAKTDPAIFAANYQQAPFDSQDKLYTSFKTYAALPEKMAIYSYCDTADTGQDALCHIVYGVADNAAYVLDVLYTREPMEVTEPASAKMLTAHAVELAHIEGNNGGRGYSRAVERLLREAGNHRTVVQAFTQTANKEARIRSNATAVMNSIHFPQGWARRWPEFYAELAGMDRQSKWAHDDAADALTGIVEKSLTTADFRIF